MPNTKWWIMAAFHDNEVERRDLMSDAIHDSTDASECEEEADGCHEEALARTIGNAFMYKVPQLRPLQEQKHQGGGRTR